MRYGFADARSPQDWQLAGHILDCSAAQLRAAESSLGDKSCDSKAICAKCHGQQVAGSMCLTVCVDYLCMCGPTWLRPSDDRRQPGNGNVVESERYFG